MKLQRNNKYNGKIATQIAAVLLASSILVGCDNYSLDKTDIIEETVTPIETVIPSPSVDPIIKATPEPTPQPTIEPIVENENIEINEEPVIDDSSELVFKRLSEEEEAEEMKKYETYDDDEINDSNLYFSACFFIEGKPKVIFGYVYSTPNENIYKFRDLFTNEELFTYHTTGDDFGPLTWNAMNHEVVEFEGIHPYFCNNDIQLRLVDNVVMVTNFWIEYYDRELTNEEVEYMVEFFPFAKEGGRGYYSHNDMVHIYLNWIPESMRVTTEELNMAKEASVKKMG